MRDAHRPSGLVGLAGWVSAQLGREISVQVQERDHLGFSQFSGGSRLRIRSGSLMAFCPERDRFYVSDLT